ncbi:hypothetical protein LTR85_008157 [Meristemomyces frigidus]|nr:hypothetical protein LTR85_008157 [Meristemomyces frigidus]
MAALTFTLTFALRPAIPTWVIMTENVVVQRINKPFILLSADSIKPLVHRHLDAHVRPFSWVLFVRLKHMPPKRFKFPHQVVHPLEMRVFVTVHGSVDALDIEHAGQWHAARVAAEQLQARQKRLRIRVDAEHEEDADLPQTPAHLRSDGVKIGREACAVINPSADFEGLFEGVEGVIRGQCFPANLFAGCCERWLLKLDFGQSFGAP